MKYPEADLIDEAGLDAAIYMRILWFGVCLFLGVGVWCIAVVLPANLTSDEVQRLLDLEEQLRNVQVNNPYNVNATTIKVNTTKDYQNLQYDLVDAYTYFNFTEIGNLTLFNETLTIIGNATILMNGTVNGTTTVRASVLQNATLWLAGTLENNTVVDLMTVTGDFFAMSETTSVNNHDYKFTSFDKYSLSNVEAGSPKMWAHLVSMYVVVIYTMWLITRFNREAVLLRLMFLGNAKRGGPSHTVLVTDVPGIVTGVTELMTMAANMAANKVSGAMKKKKSGSAGISPVTSGEVATPDAKSLRPANSQQPQRSATPVAQEMPAQELRAASGAAPVAAAASAALATPAASAAAEEQPASPAGAATAEEVATAAAEMGATLAAAEATVAPGEMDAAQEQVLSEMEEIQRGLEQVEREKQQREREQQAKEAAEQQAKEQDAEEEQEAAGEQTQAAAASATGGSTPKGRTGPGPVAEGVEPEAAGHNSGANSSGSDSAAAPEAIALTVLPNEAERQKSVFVEAAHQATVAAADAPEDEPAPPAQQLRRRRFQTLGNKYEYNLEDQRLDPWYQAKAKIESGMTPEEFVRNEFELVYGADDICVVNMVQNISALQPLVEEYESLQMALEDYLDMLQMRLKMRKKTVPLQIRVLGMAYGEWGKSYLGTKWWKKVDAVTFRLDRLRFLKEKILLEQVQAVNKAAPSAFVTFNSRKAQAVSSTSLHHHDVTAWRVQGAPAPFEVVWGNLSMNIQEKSTRVIGLWIVFWLMTMFFMIPVSLIQAMIEVPKLANIKGLDKVVNAPVIKQLLEAIIPGLILKIFLAIVPIILKFMAILSGTTSLSEVDFGVVKRFFLFQVVVVFFGNIIAGSFFNQVTQWIDNPASVLTTLGKSIPQTATFFITYLFTTGMFVKTLAFVRVPGFVIYWLMFALVGSPRAKDRLWMYQYVDFGRTVAEHTTAMLIGIVFSCMNPIVCLAAWTYFLATWLGEKYNNIYVYRRQYESAGKLWGTVFNQVMVGVYIMELTMLGLLAIKKFKWTPLGIPLVIITIGFHISTAKMYNKPWSVNALHDAADLDKREREEDAEQHESKKKRAAEDAEEVTKLYKNPCFKVPLMDLERIEALSNDVVPRVPVMNAWIKELKTQGKKPLPPGGAKKLHKAAGAEEGKAGGEEAAAEPEVDPALIPPPEITKYDDLHVEKDESDGEEKLD
ncbi:hypothetical protein HXX76_013151 [Chlamydomonas incerta]|uniref:ERD4-related membrane protein n=1 Tax=Chlamydomonas incerta TaxID=51695 RepID=A0A835ST51_CHLIN|nr:hypothetical protein HXX76_013151 [Chlamydomonas incerta]|eukprot:KAG2426170.1 hypothetical protein HXX76_013151 [Chlamydomonas incerta]